MANWNATADPQQDTGRRKNLMFERSVRFFEFAEFCSILAKLYRFFSSEFREKMERMTICDNIMNMVKMKYD